MANPASVQIYLDSSQNQIQDSDKRNFISFNLNESLHVPEGYEAILTLVDAQVVNVWSDFHRYLFVKSNLRYKNQYMLKRYLTKIPINAGEGFVVNYVNFTNYGSPITDRQISYIELSLHYEDGSDVAFGVDSLTGLPVDWSATLQFDFRQVKAVEKING